MQNAIWGWILIWGGLTAANAQAQQKVDPVEAPIPQTLTQPAPAARTATVGESQHDVEARLGPPAGWRRKGKDVTETWILSPTATLVLTIRNERVSKVRYQGRSAPNAGITDRVVDAAAGIVLTQACPALYRKPMLFLTTNDVATLRQCDANGYMLFGLYIYTGAKK